MVQLYASRRSLRVVALAFCSAAIFASATPASARSHHGAGRHHAHARHGGHQRHYAHRHFRHMARASRWERGVAQMQARGFADTNASLGSGASPMATSGGFSSSNVVAEARRYIGGNPTSRGRLWCARFMNMVLERSGHHGTGSDLARSFASYGQRVSGPGAAAVMSASSAASTPMAIRLWCQATMATGSGKRQFRVAGFTPTCCRRTDRQGRCDSSPSPREEQGEGVGRRVAPLTAASALQLRSHRRRQSSRRRSPRHRSHIRCGRGDASACAGW